MSPCPQTVSYTHLDVYKRQEIYNEDCFETMRKMQDDSIDTVLTSPFYNTNKKQGKSHTLQNTKSYIGKLSYIRYDTHVDNLTDEEYCDFTEHLFLSLIHI